MLYTKYCKYFPCNANTCPVCLYEFNKFSVSRLISRYTVQYIKILWFQFQRTHFIWNLDVFSWTQPWYIRRNWRKKSGKILNSLWVNFSVFITICCHLEVCYKYKQQLHFCHYYRLCGPALIFNHQLPPGVELVTFLELVQSFLKRWVEHRAVITKHSHQHGP